MAANRPDLDDDDVDEYIDKASVSKLRKMVRRLRAQRLSERDSEDLEKESEESEKERNKLADLHEEGKGSTPKQEVTDEDLPFDLGEGEESEDEDSSMAEGCDCSEEECDDPSCATHGKKRKTTKGQ